MKVINQIEELQKYDPSLHIIFCAVDDVEAEKLLSNQGLEEPIEIRGVYFRPIADGRKPMGEGKPEIVTIYIKQL